MRLLPRPLSLLFSTPAYLIFWCVYGLGDSLLKYNPDDPHPSIPIVAAAAYLLLSWQTWRGRVISTWLTLALMMLTGINALFAVPDQLGQAPLMLPLFNIVSGLYFILGGMHLYLQRPGQAD